MLTRYNMYAAAAINGNVAPGTSSGDAIGMMQRIWRRRSCPPEWPPNGRS